MGVKLAAELSHQAQQRCCSISSNTTVGAAELLRATACASMQKRGYACAGTPVATRYSYGAVARVVSEVRSRV
jgi:hypothetical protein